MDPWGKRLRPCTLSVAGHRGSIATAPPNSRAEEVARRLYRDHPIKLSTQVHIFYIYIYIYIYICIFLFIAYIIYTYMYVYMCTYIYTYKNT